MTQLTNPHPFTTEKTVALREGFQFEVTYTWDHLLTGHSGVNKAYAYTEEHGRNLVEYWNRFPQWKYTVTAITPIKREIV